MSEQSPPSGRRQPGCVACRERHLKCDRQRPTCSNCQKSKHARICRYEPRRIDPFRGSRYLVQSTPARSPSRSAQTSSPGSASVTDERARDRPFVNVAGSISTRHRGPGQASPDNNPCPTPTGPHGDQAIQILARHLISSNSLLAEHDVRAARGDSGSNIGQRADLIYVPVATERLTWRASQQEARPSLPLSPVPVHGASSVLLNDLECEIFGFFISHVAFWCLDSKPCWYPSPCLHFCVFKLDIGSPHRYFQSRVPPLAIEEPILLYSCLACASHIMSLTNHMDKSVEEHYMGKVLEILIPLLSSEKATCSNHALMATCVILRMSEQFLEISHDSQHHLNGAASLFMDGAVWIGIETDLAVASFWTHLRESIRICFLNEQPCSLDLSNVEVWFEEGSTPTYARLSDELWTNRVTYLLLRVCNLCWQPAQTAESPSGARTKEANELKSLVRRWRDSLPASFKPWCARKSDKQPFPVVHCFESWHVVAWQFYHAAKVMLAIYFSDVPPCANLHAVRQYIEAEVIEPTRWLCGVCISSTTNIGTNLNGSHLMGWSGQFLSGREEQRHLLHFLEQFGQKTKWPNETSCERLQQAWWHSRKSWTES